MKKSLASLFVAVVANALIAIPAIASYANSGSQPFYAPSYSDDGGCREAAYMEDDSTFFTYWDIPALADGESVSVAGTQQWMHWTAPWAPPEPWSSSEYTFTCNNGTLSSPNTSQYGGWA